MRDYIFDEWKPNTYLFILGLISYLGSGFVVDEMIKNLLIIATPLLLLGAYMLSTRKEVKQ